MKAFFRISKTTYCTQSCYKINTFLGFIEGLSRLLVPIFIWSALYQNGNLDRMSGRTLSEMIMYVLISQCCAAFTYVDFGSIIENRMRTGIIEYNLIRPISPRLFFAAERLGYALFELQLVGLPAMVIGILLSRHLSLNFNLANIVFFFVSVILGYIVSAIFEMIKSMFAFWFVNVYILNWFMDLFLVLLSGAYVPLWLCPEWIQRIASILPFQVMYYLPIEILLGLHNTRENLLIIGTQLLWIILLWFIQDILWKKSVNKLTVLGG